MLKIDNYISLNSGYTIIFLNVWIIHNCIKSRLVNLIKMEDKKLLGNKKQREDSDSSVREELQSEMKRMKDKIQDNAKEDCLFCGGHTNGERPCSMGFVYIPGMNYIDTSYSTCSNLKCLKTTSRMPLMSIKSDFVIYNDGCFPTEDILDLDDGRSPNFPTYHFHMEHENPSSYRTGLNWMKMIMIMRAEEIKHGDPYFKPFMNKYGGNRCTSCFGGFNKSAPRYRTFPENLAGDSFNTQIARPEYHYLWEESIYTSNMNKRRLFYHHATVLMNHWFYDYMGMTNFRAFTEYWSDRHPIKTPGKFAAYNDWVDALAKIRNPLIMTWEFAFGFYPTGFMCIDFVAGFREVIEHKLKDPDLCELERIDSNSAYCMTLNCFVKFDEYLKSGRLCCWCGHPVLGTGDVGKMCSNKMHYYHYQCAVLAQNCRLTKRMQLSKYF